MSEIKTLKASVRDAFSAMEEATTALDAVETDATEAAVEELEAAFATAERNHQAAVEKLERAERVEAARTSLPVEPAEETPKAELAKRDLKVGSEELIYRADAGSRSFFGDVLAATKGDARAAERLEAHGEQMAETRAINSTDGTGGDFVPPAYLLDQWISLARAGRPFANAVNRKPLPAGTDSINLPKVATGATVAAQQDGGSVSSTDITSSTVTVPVVTAAGQQDFSRQLFDRTIAAGYGIDSVIADDLLRAYATQVDTQVINGSGSSGQATGVLNTSSVISVTYTSASPTVAGLYSKISDAIQQIHTNRYLAPSLIVMHPRRWAWFLSSLDSQNRPLVVPNANGPVNATGILSDVASENIVGSIQGLPVLVDANVPTTLSTNQDAIIVCRAEDIYLFEDNAPRVRVFEEVLSGTLQVRAQVYGYFAATAARYPAASAKITGTGLAAPTF